MWRWLYLVAVAAVISSAVAAGAGAGRLVCYVKDGRTDGFSECTHLVYAGEATGDKLDALLKEYRKDNPRLKIILRVTEVDKDHRTLLKSKHVHGLELHDAHKSLNRSQLVENVETARKTMSAYGGGPLFLSLPANPELLAKYYDLRTLMKTVDMMMVQTHDLGAVKRTTYHPSRLSGLWDMMNTDSVVDLVIGLGVPAFKIVVSLPATAKQFTLQNETLSTPGSPTLDEYPKVIDHVELCRQLQKGRWTLERDQDLSAPYAFKETTWMAFEDSSSVDVKGKYARVRGLAGLALHDAGRDVETPCGPSLKTALAKVLNQQSRAPRAAVLRSLEHEILSAPGHARVLDALQVSPYRITQVVDSDGIIHSIREDTRTEFSCSRQGYFVHPRSCARFYRCVKFDQLSPEYTVFEFDCPAGLAFDSRYEVCVWPGSLPDSHACPGSSEIAPVPQTRFVCPENEGYYADPENCRWFFACLDHGKAPLTAYEFRCPFGLGFDAEKLKCDWPWLVPACGNIGRYEAEVHGLSGASLTGAAGFHGQTADAVNVAAHQSLVSGAALNNLVGIQNGFLSSNDALDSNFVASQELNNAYTTGYASEGLQANAGLGLVQATKNADNPRYSSGSLILDDYRLPTKAEADVAAKYGKGLGHGIVYDNSNIGLGGHYTSRYNDLSGSGFTSGAKLLYQGNGYADQSGQYVHDPTGDYAEPYKHDDAPPVPYIHDSQGYKQFNDYFDYGRYSQGRYEANGSQYHHENSGAYVETGPTGSGSYVDHSGTYNDNSGIIIAGVYRADGHIGNYNGQDISAAHLQQYQGYSSGNVGNYVTDGKAYTGSSYTLTAGAVNVGLVGKTTLVDAGYADQFNNKNAGSAQAFGVSHQIVNNAHAPIISQPAVAINHLGTDGNNLDGYGFVTTPTASGIPTTATPFVTTSVPVTTTYKYSYVPEQPKTNLKQIFGYTQAPITYVQPTIDAVKENALHVQVTDYNQGISHGYQPSQSVKSESSGYVYSKPEIKLEDGIEYSTPASIIVSSLKPQGFIHSQQRLDNFPAPVPVIEEPFKKIVAYTTGPFKSYEQRRVADNLGYQPSLPNKSESSGYVYSKPEIKFEDGIEYSTPAPIIVSSLKPQGFIHSQQRLDNFLPPVPVIEEPFKKIVAYTTGPFQSYARRVDYNPQAFSQQTIHKIESTRYNYNAPVETGYEYTKPSVSHEQPKIVEYTTVQPVLSKYQPQVYSHQTLHKVDASQVNMNAENSGYHFDKPASGYEYAKPEIKFEEAPKTYVQYSTPAPEIVSSKYKPQVYSQKSFHKIETPTYVSTTSLPKVELTYQPQAVSLYENPILKYTEKVNPVSYVQPSAHSFSHQTIHQVQSKVGPPSLEEGYKYVKPIFEQPKHFVEYLTSRPDVVSTTYQPEVYSHQTYHKVDVNQVNNYRQQSRYNYEQPPIKSGYSYEQSAIKFEEAPKIVQYSTPLVSTYRPKIFSQQIIHKVEFPEHETVSTTPAPKIEVQQPVAVYDNPFLKSSQNVVPVKSTGATFTQNYQPIVSQQEVSHVVRKPPEYDISAQQNFELSQGYSYNQPEIQRTVEALSSGKAYSDATLVSHQTYYQVRANSNYETGKALTFKSTTPATLAFEGHYSEHESPKIQTYEYKAPEYIPPKTEYQTYPDSTASSPIQQHSSVVHELKDNNDYKSGYDLQHVTVPVQQVSFRASHVEQPKRVETVHFSSLPDTKFTTKYNQVNQFYQSPEIILENKAEEYLPPVVIPIVTSSYKPQTFSTAPTTREYLPPTPKPPYTQEYLPAQPEYKAQDYLPPKVENKYLHASSTTRPFIKFTTAIPTSTYKSPDYLPPKEESTIDNFGSFGYKSLNPYQEYTVSSTAVPQRKENIAIQTPKSNLLGFGTVGPDAGLVSTGYATGAPIISSTYAPAIVEVSSSDPARRVRPKYKSTTQAYVEFTTAYNAPEYLPPKDEFDDNSFEDYGFKNFNESVKTALSPYKENTHDVSTLATPKRKQNIVVQNAKANLLGFGTVGPDAGLLLYTKSAPVVSSSAAYSTPQVVKKTYAPIKQEIVEVSTLPVRRTKPKVAVVTKINDFNPLLVRKLGAVCSCQSPIVVLRGGRPNVRVQDFEDYSNDYEDGRGDLGNDQFERKSARIQVSTKTTTFNPIIVPDDSFYQDYQENANTEIVSNSKQVNSKSYASSTPVAVASTDKVVRTRPRVKAVTVAPTYKTILLNQEVTPTAMVKDSNYSDINAQTFDRYGPGGLRSRYETLQGSVDCKRAGLFRHPKQCNKFYACRWDTTKQRFTLHVFNCPVQLSFDPSIGACNWPSQGPACQGDTLLTNTL